jgi:galactokinase
VIGEHIDYCGYSVLPAAIEQDFLMAYVKDESKDIVINNVEDEYDEIKIANDPTQNLKNDPGPVNYFLCGYKAILEHNAELKSKVAKPCGLKILIDSNVPPAAGLSSSSAFTVCSAITTAHANGVLDQIPKDQMANLTITSERMAGTACGGMDQTISIMGKMGTAMKIDFIP